MYSSKSSTANRFPAGRPPTPGHHELPTTTRGRPIAPTPLPFRGPLSGIQSPEGLRSGIAPVQEAGRRTDHDKKALVEQRDLTLYQQSPFAPVQRARNWAKAFADAAHDDKAQRKPFNEEFFNVSARPSAGTGRSSSVPHARISRSDAVEEHRGTPRPQSAAPIKSSSQRPHPSSLRSPTPHASRPATPVLDQVPRSDNHIGFRAPLTARDAGPAPRSQSAAPISPSSDRSHFSNILPATVHSSRPVAPLVDHSQPSDHPQIRPREPVAVGSDSNPLALPLKTLAAISFLEGSIHDSMQPIFVDLRTLASERRSAYSSVKENRLRQIRYIVSWWNMLPRVYGINGSHTTQQVPQSILEASHNWCSLAPPGSYGIFTDGALQPETILKFLRGELPALRDRTLSQVLLRIRDEDLLASFLRISPPRTRSEFGLLDGLIIGPTDLGGLMAKNARSHITWSAQIAQCWYLAYYSCQDYGAADKMTRQFPIYETDVLNSWRSRWPEYIDGHRQKISGITFAQMQTTTINQWVSQPWGLLYDFINGAPTPSEARKARNILVKSRF